MGFIGLPTCLLGQAGQYTKAKKTRFARMTPSLRVQPEAKGSNGPFCLRNLFGTGLRQLASGDGGIVEEGQQPTNFGRLQPFDKKLAVLGNLAHNKMQSKTNFGGA